MLRIIGGNARSRKLVAPDGLDTRPTLDRVRENIFNILQNHVRGAVVLDLFAGSGAMGLEAVSRGAAFCVLVDQAEQPIRCIRANVAALRMEESTRVVRSDALQYARSMTERPTLILMDPPYAITDLRAVTAALAAKADPDALMLIEHQAGAPVLADESWIPVDQRTYGIAGITLFRLKGAEG